MSNPSVQAVATRCPWCGAVEAPIWVQSHEQCPRCHQVVASCCEGMVSGAPVQTAAATSARESARAARGGLQAGFEQSRSAAGQP